MNSRSYQCPTVSRLSERFRDSVGDVILQIPLERYRSRLAHNVEKAIYDCGGECAKTMRGEYVAKIGDNCFTVKILVDGIV